MHKHIVGGLGVIALAITLAGCTASTGAETQGDEPIVFSASVPVHYVDAKQLSADSSSLVHGTVVGSTEEKIQDLLVTRYEVQVDQTLGGDVVGKIGIYQTGTPDWTLDAPLPQHLTVGESYLLFLTPMGLPDGTIGSDGYGIVGPGVWEDHDGVLEAYGNPDSEIDYGRIPLKVTLEEARSLLEVSSLGTAR